MASADPMIRSSRLASRFDARQSTTSGMRLTIVAISGRCLALHDSLRRELNAAQRLRPGCGLNTGGASTRRQNMASDLRKRLWGGVDLNHRPTDYESAQAQIADQHKRT